VKYWETISDNQAAGRHCGWLILCIKEFLAGLCDIGNAVLLPQLDGLPPLPPAEASSTPLTPALLRLDLMFDPLHKIRVDSDNKR
jgi:hypothetical protein